MNEIIVLGMMSVLFTIACIYIIVSMYGLTIHWVIHKELLVYRLSACFVTSIFGVIGIIFHFFAIVMIFYNQKRYHKTRTIFLSLLVLEFITLTPFITITWVKGSHENFNFSDFQNDRKRSLEVQVCFLTILLFKESFF
ncbi:hypothetical protein EIN_320460 [Entamoeba invadens IP1]|uniref:Uncharacterized protein n=1 Tax=Entamoeba invadens IP1 TaxID=370355 RepID=A0A0A1TZN9_ENTIV|nr:hypothetical protein EIN_320460 [Entamoeba invadens IP1]ELP87047.1 hypothetical protein EIN_320460 [Entamoeba invadens IP1]|eukprot:XP_004253818.1 hypothetical protein EIN_320460 [Entamoeba invadens IP1]